MARPRSSLRFVLSLLMLSGCTGAPDLLLPSAGTGPTDGRPTAGDPSPELFKGPGETPEPAAAPLVAAPADGPSPSNAPHSQPTLFTIVLENHDYAEVVGNTADAPFINALIERGGLATNYFDSGVHPSLPNYLYMVSGSTQYAGGVDLHPNDPPFPIAADHLGQQLTAANIPWRSYQEDMGTPCRLKSNGDYAPRHDPFIYFADLQRDADLCAATQVDLSRFEADLVAGTYRYMWISPNLLNDGHDPSEDPMRALRQSDDFLREWIPRIEASAAYRAGGVIFITWDEAEGRSGHSHSQVPMIVLSPLLKTAPMRVETRFDHASYLAFVEDWFGVPRLGAARAASSLATFFR